MVQKSKQLELPFEGRGEAPRAERSGQATSATTGTEGPGTDAMMERVLEHTNLQRALKRVRGNKGSPGIDGMTVDKLPEWLREHWPRVREELLAGTYQPHAVRRVMIPKPGGGERMLGIPRYSTA
jgi:RNA-directed DNA polymerase